MVSSPLCSWAGVYKMSSTTVKDGFDGGSDNQLKVNDDGSINVNGGGSNINIASVGGNTVTTSLPVSQEGFGTASPGYPTQISIGTTPSILLPSNIARKYAHFFNNSSQPIFIQYSSVAALNQGVKINSGTFFTLEVDNLWLGVVYAIGYVPNQLIDVFEGI